MPITKHCATAALPLPSPCAATDHAVDALDTPSAGAANFQPVNAIEITKLELQKDVVLKKVGAMHSGRTGRNRLCPCCSLRRVP